MKRFILITFLLLLPIVLSDQFNLKYNYDDFCRQFKRTYQGEQKNHHQKIFNENFEKLKQRLSNGENATVTNYFDWNQTQIDAFFPPRPSNSAKSSPNSLSRSLRLMKLGYFTIPSTFDWRTYGKVTPVKDQGNCGSCWSFSSTAQYESAIAIATNGTLYDLSEQYVAECTYSDGGGCRGGHQYFALNMINTTGGIPLQVQYPYKAQSNYFRSRGVPICSQSNKTRIPVKIQQIINIALTTNEQIEQQLLAFGPMSVGIDASPLLNDIGPNFQCSRSPGSINHGILLVGYTQTKWILKNSWGEGFGDNGYFYLPKDSQINCRLNQDLIMMHIDYGFNPTPLPPNPNPPPPPPTGSIVYNVSMTDSYGDGWQGTILGIRQNGVVVATFGKNFTSGFSKIENIIISDKVYAYIVVVQLGNWTSQVGFSINLNGAQIFRRVNGSSFEANTIFYKFCPTSGCTEPNNVTYYLTLYDSYGDGWNGNTLAVNQGGVIQTFTLADGYQSQSPIALVFKKYDQAIVYVHILGKWTYECGYELKTFDGLIVISRSAGLNSFSATSILNRFSPESVSYSLVLYAPFVSKQTQDVKGQDSSETQTISQKIPEPQYNSFKIATFVLVPLLIIFIGIGIFGFFKAWRYGKELHQAKNLNRNDLQSAKTISVEIN